MVYIQHEKLREVKNECQTIGGFLEWLFQKYSIGQFGKEQKLSCEFYPVHKTVDTWISEYFDIDLNELEEEKRHMLQSLNDE